jgi:hypothetical protein
MLDIRSACDERRDEKCNFGIVMHHKQPVRRNLTINQRRHAPSFYNSPVRPNVDAIVDPGMSRWMLKKEGPHEENYGAWLDRAETP